MYIYIYIEKKLYFFLFNINYSFLFQKIFEKKIIILIEQISLSKIKGVNFVLMKFG